MNVFIQPIGPTNSNSNFTKTISEIKYELDDLTNFIDEKTTKLLKETYGNKRIPIWGTQPGKRDVNRHKWDKMKKGDLVLLASNKRIIASATITGKIDNKKLAEYLWETDDKNNTWSLIYFLDNIKEQNIPYEIFNTIVGYKQNNKIQGFSMISKEANYNLVEALNLVSDPYQIENISKQTYIDNLKKEEQLKSKKSLDKKVMSSQREEQGYLRENLFKGNKSHKCSICGRELPIEFLWCSHIKKRSFCTLEEKMNANYIVTAMCKLGCDDLYEKGYIGVEKGKIVIIKKSGNEWIDTYLSEVEGKICLDYNEENKNYYNAHLEYFNYRKEED